MARTKYLTAPQQTTKMPPGIPYIVGNEAAERFSFYGMRAILVVFMTQYLCDRTGALAVMSDNDANKWYHVFAASNYLFPIMGAILADAFLGKFRTILLFSIVYCFGHFALAIDDTRLGLAMGLGLIALGAGGIKSCVSANVGDQFGPANKHLISRAFGWFYFAINVGSVGSFFLIPEALKHYGSHVAFGIPGVLMLLATIVFWAGRKKFVHIPPGGRVFLRETFNREGLITLGRLAIIFAFMAVFWSLYDQNGSEWVLQAQRMNLHFMGIDWLPSQIQAVNPLLILVFIPLFHYAVYPAINRVWRITPLRKIGLGIVAIGLAFLVSAWIETQLRAGLKPSIGWQLIAYAVLTAGEILASITALEFAYTQAPSHMKSLVQALYLLSISAGNIFTSLVHWFIANPDGTLKLTGPAYYHFFTIIALAAAAVFALVALRYRERNYVQGDTSTDEIEAESI